MADDQVLVASLDGNSTKEHRDAITMWLRDVAQVEFWHHLEYTWVIVDKRGQLTAQALRDRLMVLAPGINNLVVGVVRGIYSGFAPRNAHQWLIDNLEN